MVKRDPLNIAASLLLSLLLLVQGLTPAGFMPAAVESGWLVMLCPEGLPAGFLAPSDNPHAAHQQHSMAHQHGSPADAAAGHAGHSTDDHHGSVDYCQLGSALHAPAVAILPPVSVINPLLPDYQQTAYATVPLRQRVLRYHPRGPPIV